MRSEADRIHQRIRELLIAHLGALPPELDSARVPAELRPLIGEAQLLGIGDDGLREEVGKLLPPSYLPDLVARVEEKEAAFREWADQDLREERPSYEFVAFACLFELVEYVQAMRAAPTPAATPPLTEVEAAKLIEEIEAIGARFLEGRGRRSS